KRARHHRERDRDARQRKIEKSIGSHRTVDAERNHVQYRRDRTGREHAPERDPGIDRSLAMCANAAEDDDETDDRDDAAEDDAPPVDLAEHPDAGAWTKRVEGHADIASEGLEGRRDPRAAAERALRRAAKPERVEA